MKFIEKIPVDYNDSSKHLVYGIVEVFNDNNTKYRAYCEQIENLFVSDNVNYIQKQLHIWISECNDRPDILNFLADNQWILRYATEQDIGILVKNKYFSVHFSKIKMPYDAYIRNNIKKLFFKEISVPIWQQKKIQLEADIIEWLFLDTYNAFDDKFMAIMLSDIIDINIIVKRYPWILMHLSNNKRIDVMRSIHIPFGNLDLPIGVTGKGSKITFEHKKIAIPAILIRDYLRFSYELERLFKNLDDNFDKAVLEYCYHHSKYYSTNDRRNLLRQNIWVLDFVPPHLKSSVLHLLDLDELTLSLDSEKKSVCSQQSIATTINNDYGKLCGKLLALFSSTKEQIDEKTLYNFIMSDKRVLQLWPWLTEYVSNPNLKRQLIK